MIFYGTKASLTHSEQVSGIKCGSCEQQTQHTISVFGKYAYIYWIPIFPMGKKVFSECNNCKATLEKKEMNEQLKLASQNAKGNAKTPLKHWIGVAIIVALIAMGMYSNMQHKKNVVVYIETPMSGDVVEYKTDNNYTTFKIAAVTNDSIFVIDNDYEIERQRYLYKIDKDENYTTEPYSISRERFEELFEEKKLLDINRD